MKLADRASILALNDLKTETIEIPEWEMSVNVRALTAGDRDAWETAIFESRRDKVPTDVRARLVIMTVVDDAGNRLFTDADLPALTAKNSRALDRIYDVAMRLSGMGAKQSKELEKN